jgi:hypothetical protein
MVEEDQNVWWLRYFSTKIENIKKNGFYIIKNS